MPVSEVNQKEPRGALVGPNGYDVDVVSYEEYDRLRRCLWSQRTGDRTSLLGSILLRMVPDTADVRVEGALAGIIDWIQQNPDDPGLVSGILFDGADPKRLLSDESAFLAAALKVFRAGGWFADWIELQVESIAQNHLPGDVYKTPMEIMGLLVDEVANFKAQAKAAREMIGMRPDLYAPSVLKQPEAKKSDHESPEATASKGRKRNAAA